MPPDYCINPIRREAAAPAKPALRVKNTAPSLRQAYRLTVACHISDSKAVAGTLKAMFDEHGLALASMRRDQTSTAFVRVVATITSTLAGRAALVRIVNELATMPAVRRLQWETVPNF